MEVARAQLLSDTFAEASVLIALTCPHPAMLQAMKFSKLDAPVDRGAVITGLAGSESLPPVSLRIVKLPLSSPNLLGGAGGG